MEIITFFTHITGQTALNESSKTLPVVSFFEINIIFDYYFKF